MTKSSVIAFEARMTQTLLHSTKCRHAAKRHATHEGPVGICIRIPQETLKSEPLDLCFIGRSMRKEDSGSGHADARMCKSDGHSLRQFEAVMFHT